MRTFLFYSIQFSIQNKITTWRKNWIEFFQLYKKNLFNFPQTLTSSDHVMNNINKGQLISKWVNFAFKEKSNRKPRKMLQHNYLNLSTKYIRLPGSCTIINIYCVDERWTGHIPYLMIILVFTVHLHYCFLYSPINFQHFRLLICSSKWSNNEYSI